MVVAVSTAEVRGLNPVIGKSLYRIYIYCLLAVEKTKIKRMKAGNRPLKILDTGSVEEVGGNVTICWS